MSDSQIPSAAPQAHPTIMSGYPQQPNQQQFAYPMYQAPVVVAEDKTPSLCTMILIRVAVTIVVSIIFALMKIFLL